MALYYVAGLTWKPIATSVISSVKYLITSKHQDEVCVLIEELDIATTVEMIDAVLHDIHVESKTIQKSIEFVTESIKEVNRVVRHIELDVKNHRLKYFYSYRSLDLDKYKQPLQTAFKKLNTRFDMLQQLLLIDHKMGPSSVHSSNITSS
jgi:hypothetical protein